MAPEAIIVLNAGSSSLRFALYRADARPARDHLLCEGRHEDLGHRARLTVRDPAGTVLAAESAGGSLSHEQALRQAWSFLQQRFPGLRLVAAGHRVVHGGARFSAPVRIDPPLLAALQDLVPLAPLHQPHNLAAIAAWARIDPALPQVASFDTAFHHTQPALATAFALPAEVTARGVRRYGFHGLSYEYIASQLPAVLGERACDGRVVVAHLGNGASLCALHRRRSVATTMGFSTLDGLPMSSRCGSLDPGALLYLLQSGMDAGALADLLYHRSGLLGVSGISDDMRTLLASPAPAAARAVDLFVYRVGRELGSLAAALGGLDALVFTAGIGENAPAIRAAVCRQAGWLGVTLDETANGTPAVAAAQAAHPAGAARISTRDSRVAAWVVATDEDLVIARHAWDVLRGGSPAPPAGS